MSLDALQQQAAAQRAARPVFVFDLPPELVALGDKFVKQSVGMVKLDMREELAAIDAARGDAAAAGYHLVIRALVEVDGRSINKGDAEDESIVTHTDPAIRSLLVDGYTDITGVSKDTKAVFLKSRRVKVG